MLSIIEHPAFLDFHNDLTNEELTSIDGDDSSDGSNVTGDVIKVGLKGNYQDYDLFWPLIIKEQEEEMHPSEIDTNGLAPFTDLSYEQLKEILAEPGESFVSYDVLIGIQLGKYKINVDLRNAQGHNEYL